MLIKSKIKTRLEIQKVNLTLELFTCIPVNCVSESNK